MQDTAAILGRDKARLEDEAARASEAMARTSALHSELSNVLSVASVSTLGQLHASFSGAHATRQCNACLSRSALYLYIVPFATFADRTHHACCIHAM